MSLKQLMTPSLISIDWHLHSLLSENLGLVPRAPDDLAIGFGRLEVFLCGTLPTYTLGGERIGNGRRR